LVAAFLVVIGSIGFVSCERNPPKKSPHVHPSVCYNNLLYIQLGKQNWATDEGKGKNDVPSWKDLEFYYAPEWSNSIPNCPAGGIYSINRVGEPPICSVGGDGHSYPSQHSPATSE
jgi:hypothetical protein